MGRLLRWYWHPIAAASQLDENPVKGVKLLGESLVLFRDRSGRLGLIDSACAHRRVNLVFGIPEAERPALSLPWLALRRRRASAWRCRRSRRTDLPGRVKLTAYPVQELGGLVFAYLGPEPAPLLPNWDLFVEPNVLRDIGLQVVHCNWLQMQENDLDPGHVGWLHAYFSDYVLERLGRPDLKRRVVNLGSNYNGRVLRQRVASTNDFEIYDQGMMNVVDDRRRPASGRGRRSSPT